MAFESFSQLERDLFFVETLLAVMLQIHIVPIFSGLAKTKILFLVIFFLATFFVQFGLIFSTAILSVLRKYIQLVPEYQDSLNLDNSVLPITAIQTPVYVSTVNSVIYSTLPRYQMIMIDGLAVIVLFFGVKWGVEKFDNLVW